VWAVLAERKMKTRLRKLPPAITTSRALERHLDALVTIAPEFEGIRIATGKIPIRWLEPGYGGLVWVVLGQQISVAAAKAILARMEAALKEITPKTVLRASEEKLRAAGLSGQKIRAVREIALAVKAGLDFEALKHMEAEEAVAALTAIRGVGRWTAEVYLLFALGHPDIFPAGDLALQESARLAFDLDARPKEREFLSRAENWRPHRAAAARLLWAYYRVAKARDATPI
jgi:DNA-3-methyladenine glycosylase II